MTTMLISKQVMQRCCMGRTTLNNRTKRGGPGYDCDFPKPVKLSARRNAWFAAEIDAYINRKAAERTKFSAEK